MNLYLEGLLLYCLHVSNLCFLVLMMSLEGALSRITDRELSLALSSYSCQSKFVGKALKFKQARKCRHHLDVIYFYLSVFLDLYYRQ